MKLDPNLEKFVNVNINDIKVGKLNTVIDQASDYLSNITNSYQANKELDYFIRYIREISRERYG